MRLLHDIQADVNQHGPKMTKAPYGFIKGNDIKLHSKTKVKQYPSIKRTLSVA